MTACSDDEEAPGAEHKYRADTESRWRLQRISVNANKLAMESGKKSATPLDELLAQASKEAYSNEELFDFEDEEYGLGSPTKKANKKSNMRCKLAPSETKAQMRERLLEGWLSILLIEPAASAAGKRMKGRDHTRQIYITSVYLEEKAENTMAQRLGPIKLYAAWAAHNPDKWPPDEGLVIEYIDEQFSSTDGKSRTKRFVEALAFTAHVFQFCRKMKAFSESRYLNGLAVKALKAKAPRRRAVPIRFAVVCVIEVAVAKRLVDGPFLMALGTALTLVYFRARYNDPDTILVFQVYANRMLMRVNDAKTSKLCQEVNMVAPTNTLSGLDWMSVFRAWRLEQNAPLDAGWPLMPSINDGQWLKRQARSGDFNMLFAPALISIGVTDTHYSHDCKASFLDAAAADGMSKENRYRLGYHVDAADKSLDAYAESSQLVPVKDE